MNKQELIERIEDLKNVFGNEAKYIEKEFENRHDALAYRESLGLQGIVEVYVKEANE